MNKETGGHAFPIGKVVQYLIPLNEVFYEMFGMQPRFDN